MPDAREAWEESQAGSSSALRLRADAWEGLASRLGAVLLAAPLAALPPKLRLPLVMGRGDVVRLQELRGRGLGVG